MDITLPANQSTGDTFTAANINDVKDAIRAYQIKNADLENKYSLIAHTFNITGTFAAAATATWRILVPAGFTYIPVEFSLSYLSGGPTLSLDVKDAGTAGTGTTLITNATLTRATAAGVPSSTTSFAVTSIAAARVITVTMSEATNAVVDPCAILIFKVAHAA